MNSRTDPSVARLASQRRRWLPRRLELQLMLLTSVCLLLSIMGYGAYRAHAEVADAHHSVSERMVALAKNIATISTHFLQTHEPQSIEPLIQQLATVDGIYSVLVTDAGGKPVTEMVNKNLTWSPRYGTAPVKVPGADVTSVLATQAHNPTQHDFLAGTAGSMTAWQRIGSEQPLGWVRVNYRLDAFDVIANSIYVQAAKALALATAVTLMLLSLLLRPVLRALRDATQFASHMDTAMGSQLKVSHRTTEIEALGNALNLVSERLLTQHTELSNQKSALDHHAIVSITDLNGTITYANQRFCDISGYSAQELLGQNHRIIKSDEHPPALYDDLWHTISQGQVWRGDVKNRKKNGDFYWVNATIVPLLGADGLPYRYIGIRTDITANKLLEEKLRLAKEGAEAATRTKTQFLANMSHEIRTPMNAILGMLKLLHHTDLNKRQLDYASKAESAAQSLLGLINDILDFSKIDAGKMTLEARAFRLDSLMHDLSVIISANLGSKPVEVLFDIDPATPQALLGDALRLQQVLINLAGNALKFTPEGEVVVSIAPVTLTRTHASLRFAVRDTGIGIAPEHQQHIFDGFSQAEASTTRRFGGTGLGLSISRRLVELMGGALGLQSAPGQGSTFDFTITLPLADESADQTPRAPAEPAPVPKQLRVLVVDDNPTARDVLGAMARSLGWQVDTASNGVAARALVQARASQGLPSHQVLFVDWPLPGTDGWPSLEPLQDANDPSHSPMVLMVTGNARDQLSQRSAQDHARLPGILVKPVTASMLRDAAADALASQRLPVPQALPPPPTRPLQGLRILVVEDNPINQQVAQEILGNEGADIELADNGQLGVDAVHQAMAAGTPFDAVLMDLQMPVMDGFSATRLLRQDGELAKLPIIAMTANAMASDRDACLAAGMNAHMGKPFNPSALVALLQELTRGAASPSHTADSSASTQTSPPGQSTPPEPVLPSPDAVDVSGALERLGGNQPLYARVLLSYLSDIQTQPQALEAALRGADLVAAARLLHTVKGLSATVGANYMAAVARKAELAVKASRENTSSGARLPVEEVCREFRSAVASTQTVLSQVAQTYAQPVSPTHHGHSASPLSGADLRLLRELQALFKASNMQALTVFEQLQQSEALTQNASFERLAAAVAAFDFAEAADLCTHMARTAS